MFDFNSNYNFHRNRYEVSKLASDTSSIYDIQWKDNNVILTGHYDTTFRVFDVRSNCDELIYYDPYDLAVYSISYDGNFGVLCGMKYHCRVNLYDLRVPSKYIQLYFPKQRPGAKGNSSPAYQVSNRTIDDATKIVAKIHPFYCLLKIVSLIRRWLTIRVNYSLRPIIICAFWTLMLTGLNQKTTQTYLCMK